MAALQYKDDHNRIAYLGRERGSEDFTDILSYLDHSPLRYALTHDPPVVFDSLVKQFWATATVRPNAAGSHDLVATIDGREVVVTESLIRAQLQLDDANGIFDMQIDDIFAGMGAIGYPPWLEVGINFQVPLPQPLFVYRLKLKWDGNEAISLDTTMLAIAAAGNDAADEETVPAHAVAGSPAVAHPVPHPPPFSPVRETTPERQPETEWVVPNPVSPVFGPVPKPAGYVDPDSIDPIIFGPPPRPYDFVDPALEESVIFGPLPRPANYIEPEDITNLNSLVDEPFLGGSMMRHMLGMCMGRIVSLETELGNLNENNGGEHCELVIPRIITLSHQKPLGQESTNATVSSEVLEDTRRGGWFLLGVMRSVIGRAGQSSILRPLRQVALMLLVSTNVVCPHAEDAQGRAASKKNRQLMCAVGLAVTAEDLAQGRRCTPLFLAAHSDCLLATTHLAGMVPDSAGGSSFHPDDLLLYQLTTSSVLRVRVMMILLEDYIPPIPYGAFKDWEIDVGLDLWRDVNMLCCQSLIMHVVEEFWRTQDDWVGASWKIVFQELSVHAHSSTLILSGCCGCWKCYFETMQDGLRDNPQMSVLHLLLLVDMVINPPWNLPFLGAKGLTNPEQMATGKGISNPLMAVMVCPKPYGIHITNVSSTESCMLLLRDVAASFDSAVHRVLAVSFDAAVASIVSAACCAAAGYCLLCCCLLCSCCSSILLPQEDLSRNLELTESTPSLGRIVGTKLQMTKCRFCYHSSILPDYCFCWSCSRSLLTEIGIVIVIDRYLPCLQTMLHLLLPIRPYLRFPNGHHMGFPVVNAGEILDMDPYEEVAQQGQAHPLSPAYVHDLMELDEHVPVYIPEPEHPEYHAPSDDDIQIEDQPYANDASPTAEPPGYIADSESMKEDTDADSIDLILS
ncbi:hypothetical protein Tco_0145639 [Tanacetum coccineum]